MKTQTYRHLGVYIGLLAAWSMSNLQAQTLVPSLRNNDVFGYYNTVLDVSQTVTTGSARIQAIGGAQVALGGDLSIALVNPASLGFLRYSAVQFTPSFNTRETEASFLDNDHITSQSRLSLAGMGGAWVNEGREELGFAFRRSVFALSWQRTNDFNDDFLYEGRNAQSSILDSFTEGAQGKTPSQLGDDPLLDAAYDLYLINPTANDPQTYTRAASGQNPAQDERYISGKSQRQLTFAYGTSYKDILYLGASFGWVRTRYTRDRTYTERFSEELNSFTYSDHLAVRGGGVNFSLGAIYNPIHMLRIGVSVQTPSWLRLREESSFDLVGVYDNITVQDSRGNDVTLGEESYDSERFKYSYRVFTPWRLHTGLSVFFRTRAFVSFSVSYVDYRQGRIESSDFSATAENAFIEDNFKAALDYRIGGELRLPPMRIRAGYALLGAPSDNHKVGQSISGGLGVLFNDNHFIDLAVRSGVSKSTYEAYTPYELQGGRSPAASLRPDATQLWLTFGARF